MRAVGSGELQNRLGRYLALVGKGETILVTGRGKPVARILPPGPQQEDTVGVEDILQQLEAEGQLEEGAGAIGVSSPSEQWASPRPG
jgi:prevent-host-death family protein